MLTSKKTKNIMRFEEKKRRHSIRCKLIRSGKPCNRPYRTWYGCSGCKYLIGNKKYF